MSDIFCTRFGSILEEDAQVIEATLDQLLPRGHVRWLEVGMFRGGTGIGVRDYLAARGVSCEYWGIDAGYITDPVQPFAEAHVVKGRSEEVYPYIPDGFDGIFIDGCHCRNHVILDTLNYSPKVKPGGFILFHDCGKGSQGKDKQPCGPDRPEFWISTLAAFDLMRWPRPGWELFTEKEREGCPLGGTRSYRKIG
jgi:hypothetical protein